MFSLASIRNFLASSISRNTRKVVDVTPHFIPLNIQALNASLGSIIQTPQVGLKDIDLSKFRIKLVNTLKGRYSNYIILSGKSVIVNGKPDIPLDIIVSSFTPALVYLGSKSTDAIVGVLYRSYGDASKDLLNEYLNKESVDFLNNALQTTGKKFDLGYILQNDSPQTLSPEEKTIGSRIKSLFGILNSFSQSTVDISGSTSVPNDKSKVMQTRIIVESLLESYTRFKPVGPVITASISKNTASFIKSIRADILIIQDEFENPRIASEISSSSGMKNIGNMIADTALPSGSFIENIKNLILAKFLGKKSESNTREKISITTIDLRKKSKVSVTSSVGSTSRINLPPAETSLSSLLALLNNDLAKQIRENMGSGGSTTVLNYRSGRLANSYKVTAVSRERSGAITAFYTYMKFPYITFGAGGAQQDPVSRDPKRLGDKSIRELASKHVTARMRTVLI